MSPQTGILGPVPSATAPPDPTRRPSWSEGLLGVQCALCWGNGRLFADAGNGEGLIPDSACGACGGSGRVGA